MSILAIILVVLLLCLLSGVGFNRFGPVGFSPMGIVLFVLLLLYLTGNLHLHGLQ